MVEAETSVGTVEAVGFWIYSAGEAQGMGRWGVRKESSKTLKGSGWSHWEDGVATSGMLERRFGREDQKLGLCPQTPGA